MGHPGFPTSHCEALGLEAPSRHHPQPERTLSVEQLATVGLAEGWSGSQLLNAQLVMWEDVEAPPYR